MEVVPLAQEDLAVLALECDTVVGHTCKVIVLDEGAPDLATLRESVAGRLDAVPALTRRLDPARPEPAWVPDDGFDVANHVDQTTLEAAPDDDGFRAEVARLFEQRLDRERPLWRIDIVPRPGGGTALVWRIHHSLADGTTAMRYARELLWDPEAEGAPSRGHSRAAHSADHARRRAHLGGFLHREFARSRGRSPFDGRIGTRRRIAFASVPLADLHDAVKELDGATLNDAVLTILAGALQRWVEGHHGHLGEVRVRVPVSLHHEGDDASNRDSFFSLGLRLREPDPVARLRAVHAATAKRKSEHDAERLDELARELGHISPRLRRFCDRLEQSPRRFAVSVSNVPGPRSRVAVLGAPVDALYSIAEIGERHALRVAAVSLAGRLYFGFCADPGIVDDLQVMAEGVEAEAAELIAAAG